MINKARYVSRVIFFLLTVLVLIYLNRKADNHARSIAEFKFDTLQKIRKDSLDTSQKLDVIVTDTAKFIEDSSHVKEGIHYLFRLLGLFIVAELGFFMLSKRSFTRPQ
jgi:hypothetical protein